MKKSVKNLLLGCVIMVFSIILNQQSGHAGGCIASDCAALGYKYSTTDCNGADAVVCPFDSSKVFCKPIESSQTKPRLVLNWSYSPGVKLIAISAQKNGKNIGLLNIGPGTQSSLSESRGVSIYEDVAIGDVISSFSGYGIAADSPSGSEGWTITGDNTPSLSVSFAEAKDYVVNVTLSPASRETSQPKIYCTEFSGIQRSGTTSISPKTCSYSDFTTYFQNTTSPLVKIYTSYQNPTTRMWSGGVCSELSVPESTSATFYAAPTAYGCGYTCTLNKAYYLTTGSTTVGNATEFAPLDGGYFTSSKVGTWYANYTCY